MCRRVTCSQCDRPTFAGCGMHIEQVLGDVPPKDRCRCHESKKELPTSKGENRTASWFEKLVGR